MARARFQVGGNDTALALRYERALIADGDWWRCLTGSLVHTGWPHLAVNIAALALAAVSVGEALALAGWAFCLVVSAIAVGLGLWYWSPDVDWYLGASGALHGLFVAGGAAAAARRQAIGPFVLAVRNRP